VRGLQEDDLGPQRAVVEPAAGGGDGDGVAPADSSGDTIPVAASGGWLDDGTLRAEIIFLETPHRMDITCSLPDRTAAVAWRQPPLGAGRLRELHCPDSGDADG
jgi:hypothetical protein